MASSRYSRPMAHPSFTSSTSQIHQLPHCHSSGSGRPLLPDFSTSHLRSYAPVSTALCQLLPPAQSTRPGPARKRQNSAPNPSLTHNQQGTLYTGISRTAVMFNEGGLPGGVVSTPPDDHRHLSWEMKHLSPEMPHSRPQQKPILMKQVTLGLCGRWQI